MAFSLSFDWHSHDIYFDVIRAIWMSDFKQIKYLSSIVLGKFGVKLNEKKDLQSINLNNQNELKWIWKNSIFWKKLYNLLFLAAVLHAIGWELDPIKEIVQIQISIWLQYHPRHYDRCMNTNYERSNPEFCRIVKALRLCGDKKEFNMKFQFMLQNHGDKDYCK